MMRWNSTKTYTEEDMLRMQQEAVNRVHEFQARAQVPSFYGEETPIGELPAAPPVIEAQSRVVEEPEPHLVVSGFSGPSISDTRTPRPKLNPFPHETLLIMGLMFVLYNEKADNTLLAALAYFLL